MLEVEAPPASVELDQDRYKQFMQLLHKCCAEKNQAQSLEIEVIRTFFAKSERKKPFTNAEIDACIDKMADENKVMRSDDTVFIIKVMFYKRFLYSSDYFTVICCNQ